jgi:hypothetical protein
MSGHGGDLSAAVPSVVRLHFGRAAVQTIADRAHIDLLHIKGDAVEPPVRPIASPGSDVDVMVHPADVAALDSELQRLGWRVYSTFTGGSPFGHAQTYLHEMWGYLDLHRCFPGIGLDPGVAFDRLWVTRRAVGVAGVTCPVPSLPNQALILILNAARARRPIDLDGSWHNASPELRREVEREVEALDARLAFDAAFGRLDAHRAAREYRLWKAVTQGGGRVEEWWGRLLAAPTLRARVGIVLRAPLVNRAHLEHRLGHPPTRSDVVREFVDRPLRGLRELVRQRQP